MTIPMSIWEQTQHNLVEDFLDLLLPPRYTFGEIIGRIVARGLSP